MKKLLIGFAVILIIIVGIFWKYNFVSGTYSDGIYTINRYSGEGAFYSLSGQKNIEINILDSYYIKSLSTINYQDKIILVIGYDDFPKASGYTDVLTIKKDTGETLAQKHLYENCLGHNINGNLLQIECIDLDSEGWEIGTKQQIIDLETGNLVNP